MSDSVLARVAALKTTPTPALKVMSATLSKLVRSDGQWILQPFPSEEMNDVANPKGLKAVLGFEIDRNDVMLVPQRCRGRLPPRPPPVGFSTAEPAIQSSVRRITSLPSNTDGMTADRDGNVYMTALQLNGLMRLSATSGRIERFVFDPEMSWPDTLAWGPDGALFIVSNHLNVWIDGDMNFNNPSVPNFRIWKIPGIGKSYVAP